MGTLNTFTYSSDLYIILARSSYFQHNFSLTKTFKIAVLRLTAFGLTVTGISSSWLYARSILVDLSITEKASPCIFSRVMMNGRVLLRGLRKVIGSQMCSPMYTVSSLRSGFDWGRPYPLRW